LVLLLYIDFIIETQNLHGFIALLIDLPTIESLRTLVQELIESVKQ
jgi:chemotaxis protein CheC